MKRPLCFIIGLVTGLQTNAQLHGTDPDWYQAPKTAVSSAVPDLNGAVANNMVVKNNGTVVFFYRKGNANYWVGSPDDGNTWSSPTASLVTTPSPSAAGGLSSVGADIDQSDNIHIAWKSAHFTLSYSKFNGASWSTPVTIAASAGGSNDTIGFSQISLDRKGRIHVMWQQGEHNDVSQTSSCWYSRSVDSGLTFSAPVKISGATSADAAFPVADFGGTSSDTLCIPWRQNTSGNPNMSVMEWDVYGAVSTDGGASWSSPIVLAGGNPDHQWDPNLVADRKGFLHLFYHEYHNDITGNDTTASIHYKYSSDGGSTWSSDIILSPTNIKVT